MADRETTKKRPLDEARQTHEQGPGDKLATLAGQIEFFEELAGEEGPPPDAKKPAKVHSLTQNTTHRKIR